MTKRERLVMKRTKENIKVDMEWVYKELDSGRTEKSVAKELGISETTLRRRHKTYQEELRIKEEQEKEKPYYDYTF